MSDKDNPNFVERFTIRMPDGMRDAVAERAKSNGRSMNSEILDIITNTLLMGSMKEGPINYIVDLANSEEISGLGDEEMQEIESILFELVGKITLRIERETENLRKVMDVISKTKNKRPE